MALLVALERCRKARVRDPFLKTIFSEHGWVRRQLRYQENEDLLSTIQSQLILGRAVVC